MLLVTAQQSNSADITINVDPTVATPQSVPGISCTAHIDNRRNYEDRQVGEDVLFIDSTNRLDQGDAFFHSCYCPDTNFSHREGTCNKNTQAVV